MTRYAAAAALAAVLAWGALHVHNDPTRDGRAASFSILSGAALGVIFQRSRFCFTSACRDLFLIKDRRGALGVLAALAVGSVGFMVVFGARLPDPGRYLPDIGHLAPANWHLLLGGACFGLGMVLAGGCVSGSLYRLGEGSLVAPVTLLAAVPGYWLGYLFWEFVYLNAIATGPVVWLPKHLGYAGALGLQLAVIGGLAALLLWKYPALPPRPGDTPSIRSVLRRTFVTGWSAPLGGLLIGILATFTLLRTAPLGVTSELGRLSLRSGQKLGFLPAKITGLGQFRSCSQIEETGALLGDGALFVITLVAGSAVAALLSGEFRWRVGKPRTYLLAVPGGLLIGLGSALSLGCTVGTLLSGIMAFSLSGWVFAAGLLGGAWAGGRILRRMA